MKKTMIIAIVLVLIVIAFSFLKLIKGFFPLPIGVRHLIHLIVTPKNLYQPIISDRFLFSERDFTKTYYLEPKYLDIYEIGFFTDQNGIESTYKFKGKLKVEFYWKDRFLFDSVITSMDSAGYKQNDMTRYKQISLYSFNIPLQNKYTKEISVKLTVLEPDQELKRFSDSIKIYIAVNATP